MGVNPLQCTGLYVRHSFGFITFGYDKLELHTLPFLVHVLVTMHRFVWIYLNHTFSGTAWDSRAQLIDQYLNFTFCTGRVWDPWTGCELKSWPKERVSPAQDFPSLGQDNLTAFLRKFDIPDKKYTDIYRFILKYRRNHPLCLKFVEVET